MKGATKIVLLLTLFLQGCAFESALLDVQEPRAGFVITRPPVQISYRGDVSPESQAFALNMLKQLQSEHATDYKFNENTNVRLNSIDGKSDKIDVTLIEHASSAKSDDEPQGEHND